MLKFKRDTSFRKQFFVPDSFAHPAKMDAQLLIWLVENYSKPGEVILDPMAGSGTTMLACQLGRNVVLVELEEKFCKMMRDNWEIVKMHPQLGYEMGECQIIQGDARELTSLCDKIITSPPFADAEHHYRHGLKTLGKNFKGRKAWETKGGLLVDKIVTSPPYAEGLQGKPESKGWEKLAQDPTSKRYGRKSHPSVGQEYSDNPSNIGNLPYGQIDKIVTSPPYAEVKKGGEASEAEGLRLARAMEKSNPKYGKRDTPGRLLHLRKELSGYADNPNNLGNLPYGNIDSIITSPPYESGGHHNGVFQTWGGGHAEGVVGQAAGEAKEHGYGDSQRNIGNLKSQSYLEAMLQVYQQCHKVLKSQGLMILVTKNFIRNKQVIRLDEDTIKLCEQSGFKFLERHYRKLPAQSFWRIIYQKKHPEVETIDFEDILVFERGK